MEKIKLLIKLIYNKIFPNIHDYLKKELQGCDSILDLGCGFASPMKLYPASIKVGVDAFGEYIEKSKKAGLHTKYIKEDITKVAFEPKSFDAVVMIDVLEHLTREDGEKMIKKMENWAKKKVLIYTTNGLVPQGRYDKNPFQEHKSGWRAENFEKAGFRVAGINGCKGLRGSFGKIKYRPFIFWMLVSDLTQKVTYYIPNLAFQLFAVKNIKNKI